MNPLNDKPIEAQGQDQSRGEPMDSFNDKPIKQPGKDRFGFSPFAEAIAQSIIKNDDSEGTVMAIHGPWGSGKSSVINLVKHYLEEKIKSNQSPDSFEFPRRAPNWLKSLAPKRRSRQPSSDMSNSSNVSLEILDFKCWWFRGEEALMIEFFHQLYSALNESGLEAKEAVRRLGLMTLRDLAIPSLAAGVPIIGPIIGKMISDVVSKRIQEKETVKTLYDKISQALLNSDKRYLMIIDDIDRLSKDEMLLIFRLVKSVGRLPKITYLLAYDREVTEKIVSESEGPHYLEKIVQAPFDIPYPLRSDLLNFFWNSLNELRKNLEELDNKHLNDIFHAVVAPEIQSPRDSIRIVNVLSVTWPAVAGEVDPADFLALETLRVKQPRLHAILKANKDRLIGIDIGVDADHVGEDRRLRASRYEGIFLGEFQNGKREEVKKALPLLFPRLGSVWGNRENYGQPPLFDLQENWERQRRACSPKYFDAYFRFSLSPEALSMTEIRSIIENSGNENYVKQAILEANSIDEDNENGNNLERLLDGLKPHVKTIPIENAPAFLSGLFNVYDVINIDKTRKYILPLLKNLLLNRTDLNQRSAIIYNAIMDRNLGLMALLAQTEYRKHNPHQSESPTLKDNYLMTESDIEKLRQIVLNKIQAIAKDGSLLENPDLLSILYTWITLDNSEDPKEAKSWCMNQLRNRTAVEIFAKMFVKSFKDEKILLDHALACKMRIEPLFDISVLTNCVRNLFNESQPGSERYLTLQQFIKALS